MRTIAVALVVYWLATQAQPAPGTTLAWTLVPLRTPPPSMAPRLPASAALPHGVNQVTASSTNAGWLAAWDEEHVMVSFDAGFTFSQVLDGPGEVSDVTFRVTHEAPYYIPEPLRPQVIVDRAGRKWWIDETKDGEDAWLAGGR